MNELQDELLQRMKQTPEETSTGRIRELEMKVYILEETGIETNQKINDLQTSNHTLELELSKKARENNEITREMEEVEKRCTTYFNHLQVSQILSCLTYFVMTTQIENGRVQQLMTDFKIYM